MKITTKQTLNAEWMRQNDKDGKFHIHKWINYEDLVLAIMMNI